MRKLLLIGFILSVSCDFIQAQLSEKEHFEISKQLNIYNALFKELNLFYVDSIDAGKITTDNIDFMLKRLDPYTEYIPEEELSDFLVTTTGEYGGIGAGISSYKGKVFISEPFEGMPASRAGLQAGDVLLEINGETMEGRNSSYASERLKGQPNTTVKVKFQRPGEKKPREASIDRKRIEIDPVTYYGILQGNTGYIYLSGFTTHSAQSVKAAFEDLKTKGITSLVIDVRDNGGGVVEDCLEILNYFIPKGNLLLTMKGKVRQLDRTYRSTQQAIDSVIPMAVLVNRQSASASEILAGTLQDLDRAVIIGNRTYGKGLVQSPRQLPYNGQLKVTTAKYYIPSGRCIQAIDYSRRNNDESVSYIPDSLTSVFYTSKGRPVRDGGGILPDFVSEEKKVPAMIYYLEVENLFFEFVVQWRTKHPTIASPEKFAVTDEIYGEFKDFLKSKDFNYDRQSGKALENLRDIMEFEGYSDTASEEFKALENKLKPDLDRDLDLYKSQLSDLLARQIMKQYYFVKGEIIYALRSDDGLKKALETLSDKDLYLETFTKQ
ncbi:MAG: S41 family peptidase [Dysgonamonadaceae bacterium]|jgi:carboxyl-terminal processing protease|nr:S41 family peptidase [Dysgonamonadaceae bacterium]